MDDLTLLTPPLDRGYYKVIYLYNISETYHQVAEAVKAWHVAHVSKDHESIVDALIFQWFTYQLKRVCYVNLVSCHHYQESSFHNEVLIGLPLHLTTHLYHCIVTAFEHLMHPAVMEITHRELILTFDLRY